MKLVINALLKVECFFYYSIGATVGNGVSVWDVITATNNDSFSLFQELKPKIVYVNMARPYRVVYSMLSEVGGELRTAFCVSH